MKKTIRQMIREALLSERPLKEDGGWDDIEKKLNKQGWARVDGGKEGSVDTKPFAAELKKQGFTLYHKYSDLKIYFKPIGTGKGTKNNPPYPSVEVRLYNDGTPHSVGGFPSTGGALRGKKFKTIDQMNSLIEKTTKLVK